MSIYHDKIYEIGLLLDFYGQLITKRQHEILDLHYNNDYSLGEISEQLSISRQGVYDNIKKGKAVLNNLESKLGLVTRHSNQRRVLEDILKSIEGINVSYLKDNDQYRLEKSKDKIKILMKDLYM